MRTGRAPFPSSPDLKIRDRFFWLLVRSLYPDWKRHLILVRPETVLRWHRQGWQLRCPTGPRSPAEK
jgi:hypothetical protein